MGLNEMARDFVSTIKSTREYSELLQSKANIERNFSLKNEVIEFNKKLGEIYSSNKSPSMIELKLKELNKQFGNLSQLPEVDKFLKSSKAFNDMMVKVYKTMNDSFQGDLRFQ